MGDELTRGEVEVSLSKEPFADENKMLKHDAAQRARIAALEAENAKLRDVLYRKGYRERCDIPACNCGDQWTHGGHAETRLAEIYDALGERTNGTTALKAIEKILEELTALDSRPSEVRSTDEPTCEWVMDEYGISRTSCGGTFDFFKGESPNGHLSFCPYCGKRIKERGRFDEDAKERE